MCERETEAPVTTEIDTIIALNEWDGYVIIRNSKLQLYNDEMTQLTNPYHDLVVFNMGSMSMGTGEDENDDEYWWAGKTGVTITLLHDLDIQPRNTIH